MEKEETLFRKRIIELSNLAYNRGVTFYTDFLNLNELNILHTTPKDSLPVNYITFGGYESSERQIASFVPDAFSMYREMEDLYSDFPIDIIRISPVREKFSDELSHRDYLGALLNLGIERTVLGDIVIEDKKAYVFVKNNMTDYIVDGLTRVKHTSVMVEKVDKADFKYSPNIEQIKGNVASVRLDSLIALAFKSSRSKIVPLIENGKVFVNGKMITNNGCKLKENDIISVRGMGRFQYREVVSETRKGRLYVTVDKYI